MYSDETEIADIYKSKSFLKFTKKPEDPRLKYKIMQNLIQLKQDFEIFTEKFVEYSR